jgi:hypothetical protein
MLSLLPVEEVIPVIRGTAAADSPPGARRRLNHTAGEDGGGIRGISAF